MFSCEVPVTGRDLMSHVRLMHGFWAEDVNPRSSKDIARLTEFHDELHSEGASVEPYLRLWVPHGHVRPKWDRRALRTRRSSESAD